MISRVTVEPFVLKASENDIERFNDEISGMRVSSIRDNIGRIEVELGQLNRELRDEPRPRAAERIDVYTNMMEEYVEALDKYSADWREGALTVAELVARTDTMENKFSALSGTKTQLESNVEMFRGTEWMLDFVSEELREGIRVAPTAEIIPLIPLYEVSEKEIPPPIRILKDAFDFYWVKFILKLHYPRGWRIDSLDPIKVVFNPDDPRHTRPVAWDLFPKTKMRDMFKIDGQFGIDLDLKFQIPIQVAAGAPLPIGEVGPKAKVSFLIGPWNYSFKKASILSSGELDCEACWRIHDSYELLNSGDLQINMIMKKLEAVNAVKADVSFEGKMSTGYFLWKNELPIEGSQTIKLLPQP